MLSDQTAGPAALQKECIKLTRIRKAKKGERKWCTTRVYLRCCFLTDANLNLEHRDNVL